MESLLKVLVEPHRSHKNCCFFVLLKETSSSQPKISLLNLNINIRMSGQTMAMAPATKWKIKKENLIRNVLNLFIYLLIFNN